MGFGLIAAPRVDRVDQSLPAERRTIERIAARRGTLPGRARTAGMNIGRGIGAVDFCRNTPHLGLDGRDRDNG